MSITAVVHNNMIQLPIPVADGTSVEIILSEKPIVGETKGSFFDSIRDFAGTIDDLPPDFAAEHDHYIHGRPKMVDR
ncbi:hypothetical protein [Luteolibacter sp. Populi]|uniref:hypothetical protein n=1 Tax=Luteolibacter sp. Populi TaxID=3230487 RepID=UPI0034659F5D